MTKRLRQLGYVARHPLRHWLMLRLLSAARRQGLAAADRSIGWKYLGDYLAGDLTTGERAASIASHYQFLLQRLPRDGARQSWANGLHLWERRVGADVYVIRLEQSTFAAMEGETQLSFYSNDTRLFTLTFAIVGGQAIGLSCDRALFIGGMQGGFGCRQTSRIAARDNGEIAPSTMVVLAARAVAEALNIDQIAAVSSEKQASLDYAGGKIRFSYDDYWAQLGSEPTGNGFFLLDPARGERSLDHLSSAHRARARRKARLKADLASEMHRNLQSHLATAC